MKIRTRLTVLFTFFTATILLAFAFIIYHTDNVNREKEFYSLLKKEAVTKANLILNAQVEPQTLQDIYRSNRQILNEVEVAIYDTEFNLLYHDAMDIDFVKETQEMIDEIKLKNEIMFYQDDWQVVGLQYPFRDKVYIVTAAAYDQYGFNKLNSLRNNMIVVFVISVLFIYLAGLYFAKKAFDPVKEMVKKVKRISATNLDFRLAAKGSRDELSELANTFNEMLNRLEKSFDAQKHFVSNISHELRTPLTAIHAELQLTTETERSNDDYKRAIALVASDTRKLIRLSNSLLDLAKVGYDPSEIAFKPIRIDEVSLDARQQVRQTNADYKIDIHFENDFESDTQISAMGNAYLLKVAFVNLFENGCKFSNDKQSIVSVVFESKKIILRFTDKGIGISEDDLKNIFTPFYRGENKKFAEGNGIGLSLTQKIISLHQGSVLVSSEVSKGSEFTIELPHL